LVGSGAAEAGAPAGIGQLGCGLTGAVGVVPAQAIAFAVALVPLLAVGHGGGQSIEFMDVAEVMT